ncbi:MAG: EAL domain-containing protein [Gammaproteobacteria bacterium]|nr:EAL domain-containing protein [Gammaproteobacteria bacterium]
MRKLSQTHADSSRHVVERLGIFTLLLAILLYSDHFGFALFHSLAELFTILVSLIMAVVAWQGFRFTRNHYLLVLGSGYFWVGLLGLLHTFTYPGVTIITPPSVDTSAQLWMATRLLEAITLLSAVFFLSRAVPAWRLNLLMAGYTVAVTAMIFNGQFPATYSLEYGLTPTKIYGQYVIIAILLIALWFTWSRRVLLDRTLLRQMLAAILFTIAAEITFSADETLHASFNVIGHVFKFISFWLVFDALILASLTKPYTLMSNEANSFHAIPMPVLLLAPNGTILSANPAASQMSGLAINDMLGKHCHPLFHPHDIGEQQCPLCQHIRNQEELRGFEMPYDNDTWHEFMLTPIGATVPGIIHVSHDITLHRQLLNSVRQNEQKYRNLVENIKGDLFFYTRDLQGEYQYVSASVERVLGFQPEQFLLLAPKAFALLHQPTGDNTSNSELEINDAHGKPHQLEISESTIFNVRGEPIGTEGIAYDVSRHIEMDRHLRAINDQLTQSQQRLALHVQRTPLGVIEFDTQFRITQWNHAAEKIFGYRRNEVLLKSGAILVPANEQQNIQNAWDELMSQQRGFQTTRHNLAKDGHIIICEWYNSVLTDENDQVIGVASLVNDITDREIAEARLNYQANYDSLTELPNRQAAMDSIDTAINSAKRNQTSMAMLFIDLDLFKHVNDTLGHAIGDEMLIEVANRLRKSVRSIDTVARLGGDEFLIILQDLPELRQAKAVVRKVLSSLRPTFHIGELKLHIAASIGISGYPDDSDSPQTLLAYADTAMYKAKEKGRNTYAFFDQKMSEKASRRLQLESRLRHAIAQNELELYFQPQISLQDQRIIGAEALLRWRDDELGQISPDEFIPLAEDTGLIQPIGQWVLDQACQAATKWQDLYPHPIRVSVNFSPRQLHDENCLMHLEQALHHSRLPGHLLEMEITERLLLENIQGTLNLLFQIKQLGIRLALDDFGTGYSSLGYLKRFPFDALKIDKAFVLDVLQNKDDAALCQAIIAMAKILGLEVVAEGTETLNHVSFLKQSGADTAQGYVLARPMPLNRFLSYITQYKPDKSF